MAQLLRIQPRGQKRLDAQLLEPLERLRARRPAHHSDHFARQLERGPLELDSAGGNVEAEAEVDVQDVARVVDHDVAVMPVLELQQVGDDAVGGHALDEVVPSLLEPDRVLAAVLRGKVIVETVDRLPANHVAGNGVGQHVDDAAAGGGRCHAVGVDVDVQTDVVENAAEGGDHLQGEDILAAVVTDFEDGGLPDFVGVFVRDGAISIRLFVLLCILEHAVCSFHVTFVLFDPESRHIGCFGVALQWFARFAVDANDDTIRVTRQVDTNFNFDLAEFLLDLFLLFGFAFLNEGTKFAGDVGYFFKEGEFSFIERPVCS